MEYTVSVTEHTGESLVLFATNVLEDAKVEGVGSVTFTGTDRLDDGEVLDVVFFLAELLTGNGFTVSLA